MRWHLLPILLGFGCAAPSAAHTAGYSILAYNVLYDAEALDASMDAIAEADADLVCLTELTPRFLRRFEARLGERYPFRSMAPRNGTWGVGIASRFPLSDARRFAQRPHRIPAMEARVRLDGQRVRVACLHLFPPVGKHRKSDGFFETMEKNAVLRQQQAAYLVRRYANEAGPVLLVGDMNESPGGAALDTFLVAGFRFACDAPDSSCGGTWPGATYYVPALFAIDHILGRGADFERARVIRGGGSDHYPVAARFTLR